MNNFYPNSQNQYSSRNNPQPISAIPQKKFGKKNLRIILALVIISIAIGVGFYVFLFNRFNPQLVSLKISGPEKIISTEEIEYNFNYQNNSKFPLNQAQLKVVYPQGSIIEDDYTKQASLERIYPLSNIAPHSINQGKIKFRLLGEKESSHPIKFELRYRPGKSEKTFVIKKESQIKIISVPIILTFDLPEQTVPAQNLSITAHYINNSDIDLKNLQIELSYPLGFTYNSAYPQPSSSNNLWIIKEVKAGQRGKIIINGSIDGQEGEIKNIYGKIELSDSANQLIKLTAASKTFKITLSPLSLQQTVNGEVSSIASLGNVLNFQVHYQNTSEEVLKNITIESHLSGTGFDFSTIQVESGFFDSAQQKIIWNSVSQPNLTSLNPGDEGTVSFSIKIKKTIPINNWSDKNLSVSCLTSINSENHPLSLQGTQIGSQVKTTIKLNSDLRIVAKGYYQDEIFSKSGPIPPKVNQSTTYTFHWYLFNSTNDLENIQVEAVLPSYMRWEHQVSPSNANIKYDSSRRRIIWQIDKIEPGVGFLKPPREVVFQLKLVPSITQVGSRVILLPRSCVKATDLFTDQNLENCANEIYSDLPDDPSIDFSEGTVQQ